jgi:DNA-binding MarR family transcriptional regulator
MNTLPHLSGDFNPHVNGNGHHNSANDISIEMLLVESEVPPSENEQIKPQTGPVTSGTYHFQPFSLADVIARPPKQWLIDQIFGPGDIGTIYGLPGSGKTFATVDLIMAGCLGKRFALHFKVARPLTIAYCAGEGHDGLPQRFAAAAHHHGMKGNHPNFTFFEIVPQLFEESSPDSIEVFITEWKARQEAGLVGQLDLLIVDTQHSATVGADENSSTAMGKVLASAKAAIRELGCAVLLIHHSNKQGTGERGSSAMRGAMDFMLEFKQVNKLDGTYSMSCSKLKDGRGWAPRPFRLVATEKFTAPWVSWEETNDDKEADKRKSKTAREILEVLSEHVGSRLIAREIADALAISPQAVNRVVPRLEKEGLLAREELERNGGKVWHYFITAAGVAALQEDGKSI